MNHPSAADIAFRQGVALRSANRLNEATDLFRQAIALDPASAEAHYQLAYTLSLQGRLDEALPAGQMAVRLDPAHVDAYCNIGYVLINQGRLDDAIASLKRALAIRPDSVKALNNLGTAYIQQGNAEAAVACFARIISAQPDFTPAYSSLLMITHNLAVPPADLYAAHRRFAERFEAPLKTAWPVHRNRRDPGRRLRLGYVSPDFQLHSVALFFEPILAARDRENFEVYAYHVSNGHDDMTGRISSLVDHWVPSAGLSDDQLGARIQSDEIDILVDLAGHTVGNRLLVFARKPAPIQVTYLGYPSTTGLSAMDYRLTTADVDPPGSESWHSEQLYRLPRTLWCFRPMKDGIGTSEPAPAPDPGVVTFGSMNNLIKVSPEAIVLWADILRAVPRSRLIMTNVPEGSARARLHESFAGRGVDTRRIQLNGRLPNEVFRALTRQIDVSLDSFPYSGTTTVCEALSMGIPVVTLVGQSSVSRSAFALLKCAGLEALCTASADEYRRLAIDLASDPGRLSAMRDAVLERFHASPIRDPAGLARDIEDAFRDMWRRWCASRMGP